MDIEFHYHSIYIIAKHAGFNEKDSFVIAYSSQYTDDNNTQCVIKTERGEYKNYISQTMDILKPKKELMRIYPCFHFFPGDFTKKTAMRKDGELHLLNTTPDSKNVRKLLDKALETKNLYRIGIALHTYADSFAHQNFVGYYDCFNGMKGLLQKVLPNIGHADAKTNPDIPGKIWIDKRLSGKYEIVRNTERFLKAAKRIFDYLWELNNKNISSKIKSKKKRELTKILSKCYYKEFNKGNRYREIRLSLYKTFGQMPEYREELWLNEALKSETPFPIPSTLPIAEFHCEDSEKFYQSRWYNFQQAVKNHQSEALNIMEPVLKKMEIDLSTF